MRTVMLVSMYVRGGYGMATIDLNQPNLPDVRQRTARLRADAFGVVVPAHQHVLVFTLRQRKCSLR